MNRSLLREFVRQSLLLEGDPPSAVEAVPQSEMPPWNSSDLVASLDEFTTSIDVVVEELKKALKDVSGYPAALAEFDRIHELDFSTVIDNIQGPLAGPATLDATDGMKLVSILTDASKIDMAFNLPLPLTIGYACAKITETWDVGNVTSLQTAARRTFNSLAVAGTDIASLSSVLTKEILESTLHFLYDYNRLQWSMEDAARRSGLTPEELKREDDLRSKKRALMYSKINAKPGRLPSPEVDSSSNKWLRQIQSGEYKDDDADVYVKPSNIAQQGSSKDASGTGTLAPITAAAIGSRGGSPPRRPQPPRPIRTSRIPSDISSSVESAVEDLASNKELDIKPTDQVLYDLKVGIPGQAEENAVSAVLAKKEKLWIWQRAYRNSKAYKKVMQSFIKLFGSKAAAKGKVDVVFQPKKTFPAGTKVSGRLPVIGGAAAMGMMAASARGEISNMYHLTPAAGALALGNIAMSQATGELAGLILEAYLGTAAAGFVEVLTWLLAIALGLGFLAGLLVMGLFITDYASGPLGLWSMSFDKLIFGEEGAVSARAEAIAAASPEAMKEVSDILKASGYKDVADKLAAIVPTFTEHKIYRKNVMAAITELNTACKQLAPTDYTPSRK